MLEDYRELLISQPTDEQAREMLNILSAAVLAALAVLPRVPENESTRRLLDDGTVAALHQKVAHVLTREEFDREVAELLERSGDTPARLWNGSFFS